MLTLASFFGQVEAQGGAWTRKADVPTHRLGPSASVVRDSIYVFGGLGASFVEVGTNEVYDPLTDTWGGRMPRSTPGAWPSSAVVNEIIYCIGGGYPTAKDNVEAYDPATNTWTTKAKMPTARCCAQAVVVNGVIYNMGGYPNLRTCEAYDPNTNTWTPKTDRPESGGVFSVAVYDGIIYTFGGGSIDYWPAHSTVYAYNPQTDTWTKKKDMPTVRFALQTYHVDGKIYAIGGSNSPNISLATVEVYDPLTDSWTQKADMPKSFSFFAGAQVNGKIYVIGGTPDWSTGGFEVWEYDPNATISVTPQAVNFGNVLVGESSDTISVEIKNLDLHALTVNSVTLVGTAFSLCNLPSVPVAVAPSDSILVGVFFRPTIHGNANAQVVVATSDTLQPAARILLEGRGILYGPELRRAIDRVNAASYSDRPAIVDSFLAEHPITPLIEQDSIAQFIYRGNATSVNVPGDANDWRVSGCPMTRLSSTDLWYCSEVFEPDARLDYLFLVNGSTWIPDPRNPATCAGAFGPASVLAMPSYVHPAELSYYAGIPHGLIYDTTFHSSVLGNARTIRVYTPPGYSHGGTDSFQVAVFHDGLDWVNFAMANNALDYLIYHDRIRPLIAVFVPPVSRDPEYIGALQDQFAAFIATELMPYVDACYRTQRRAMGRASIGISNGGNIALWIMAKYPQEFGNAASYSGFVLSTTASAFDAAPVHSCKVYLDAGTYDAGGFLDISRNLRGIMQTRGYDYRYNEWHEGHSWGNWGAHLDNALEFFFPGSAVDVQREEESPKVFKLVQNYPNPFNPSTTIKYELPRASAVRLTIYDMLGREVSVLVNEKRDAGVHEVKFDASGLSSGVYFYRLTAGSYVQTRKLLLLR